MIRPSSATRKNGAALLIVLAFVVLLTALIVKGTVAGHDDELT